MMQYAIFARPVVTIYDLPQATKQSEAGLVSTIGDEGLYGQACQVRTAFETSNINAVMDGELDGFINAYLTAEATGNWATK